MIEIGSELRRTLRLAECAGDVRRPGLAATLDELRSNGYVVLERLVPDELIDQVAEELEPWFEKMPSGHGNPQSHNATHLWSVLAKSRASHALALNELVLSIMHEVLGPYCDWFQLNQSHAERIHPGARSQVPRRDEQVWPFAKSGMEYVVSVMWALSGFTAENGATMLWSRANQHGQSARASIAEMPRGSALVYLGSVKHCAGANRSDAPRTGLLLSYCLGWLKQNENAFLAYPPAVAKQFPAGVRDLLGYRIHRPSLGGCDGQDPAVLFEASARMSAAIKAASRAMAFESHD